MPITFVQSRSSNAASGSSLAFSSNNTAGNMIVVAVCDSGSGQTFSVSDTKNNTYISTPSFTNDNTTSLQQLFYSFSIGGGANTVSVSGINNVGTALAIHEFSGVSFKDKSSTSSGVGNSQSSGTVATVVANELLFGFTGGLCTNLATITHGTSYNLSESSTGTSALPPFITQYQIVAATGVYSSTSTTTTNKGTVYHWGGQILTFSPTVPPNVIPRTNVILFGL